MFVVSHGYDVKYSGFVILIGVKELKDEQEVKQERKAKPNIGLLRFITTLNGFEQTKMNQDRNKAVKRLKRL